MLRKFCTENSKNEFYFNNCTEIPSNSLSQSELNVIYLQLEKNYFECIQLLSIEMLPQFLNSKIGYTLINTIRERELNNIKGPKCPLRTVAYELPIDPLTIWYDMFKVLTEYVPFGTYMHASQAIKKNLN